MSRSSRAARIPWATSTSVTWSARPRTPGFPVIGLKLRVGTSEEHQAADPLGTGFLRIAGNPLIPPMGEAVDRALSPGEITEFTAHLKPLVESGAGQERLVIAYLAAVKE